jgi:hypothetical protein
MARAITLQTCAIPANFTATPGAGGSLPAGTYYYKIIALRYGMMQDQQIRSAPSAEISATVGASGKVDLSWSAVPGASGYIIWRTRVSGDYRHQFTPQGNNFKCKALRTSFNNYTTTTATTFSDTGSISTAETDQSNAHFLFLDFAVPRLDISGGDALEPFSMEHLYQQDLSGGWGLITRTGDRIIGYTYTVKATIYSSTAIYWEEEYFSNTWVLWGGFWVGHSGSTTILGYESAFAEWLCGVRILAVGHYGYYAFPSLGFYGASRLYGCSIDFRDVGYEGYTPKDPYNTSYSVYGGRPGRVMGLTVDGGYTWKGCRVAGSSYRNMFTATDAYALERCDFVAGERTLAPAGNASLGSVTDVQVKDAVRGITVENVSTTFRGGKVVGGNNAIFLYRGHAVLVGTDFDDANVYWYTGSLGLTSLTVKETFNLRVIDGSSSPIAGAAVRLVNKDGAEQFSLVSDAGGKIAQQDVPRLYAAPADNTSHQITAAEKTDFNPFTLTIAMRGYETYTATFTIESGGIDWTIRLKPPEPVPAPVILDRLNVTLEDDALLIALEDESLTIIVDRLP